MASPWSSALHHRLPAMLAALLSSAAIVLTSFSGLRCDFLTVSIVDPTYFLIIPESNQGFAITGERQTSIGIFCNDGMYDRDCDDMWELSRIFWILGLAFGSCTALIAWAVASFVQPTTCNWRSISILAAVTAVVQVPAFILLEAEPCVDFSHNQSCSLGAGAYLLMSSVIMYISVCVCTQCLDPPQLDSHIDSVWKVQKGGRSRKCYGDGSNVRGFANDFFCDSDDDQLYLRAGEHNEFENIHHISRILPASKIYGKESKTVLQKKKQTKENSTNKKSYLSWFSSPASAAASVPVEDLELAQIETESTNEQEDDEDDIEMDANGDYNFEERLDVSQTIVRVLPDKKSPPTDTQTHASLELAHKGEWPRKHSANNGSVSNTAILADLANVETFKSSEELKKSPPSSDNILHGVRNLTCKLKRGSKLRKNRRQWRNGYAQMTHDEEEDEFTSDDGGDVVNSPPLEVNVPALDQSKHTATSKKNGSIDDDWGEAGIQFQMPDLSDHEDPDDDIYLENEAWVDLTAVTPTGMRRAATNDFSKDDRDPFACSNSSVGSCHSDPEPVLYESGSEDTCSLEHRNDEVDISTLSDDLSGDFPESAGSSDSRPRRRKVDSRRIQASSPVESIKSHCSLLHTTINEETEDDIENELGTAYSLSRTVSAPEPRSMDRSSGVGMLSQMGHMDLMKTLDREVYSYDEVLMSQRKDDVMLENPVEEGDIPMLPRQLHVLRNDLQKDNEDAASTTDTAESMTIDKSVSPAHSQQQNKVGEEQSIDPSSTVSLSSTKQTLSEPALPTKQNLKDPAKGCMTKDFSKPLSSSNIKHQRDPTKASWNDPASRQANSYDENSDTDDTGCLSRTSDSFSDDSGEADIVSPRRIVVRSRSFECPHSSNSKKSGHSKSLSPSRSRRGRLVLSRAHGGIDNSDPSVRSTRDTRIRRIQRIKGYVPLEENSGLPPRSPPRRMPYHASNDGITPKRRTVHVSPDDGRMKNEAILFGSENIHSPFFDGPFQLHLKLTKATKEIPAVSVGDEESDNDLDLEQSHDAGDIGHSRDFDSMLEHLDLQLIDLRRPHGAEYGDDECSL